MPDDSRRSWSDGKAYVPKFRRIDGFGIRGNTNDELRRISFAILDTLLDTAETDSFMANLTFLLGRSEDMFGWSWLFMRVSPWAFRARVCVGFVAGRAAFEVLKGCYLVPILTMVALLAQQPTDEPTTRPREFSRSHLVLISCYP